MMHDALVNAQVNAFHYWSLYEGMFVVTKFQKIIKFLILFIFN
jgi:hypothetical protein